MKKPSYGSGFPAANSRLPARAQSRLGNHSHKFISTDPMPDLVSGYRKLHQLGIDRLLAMVAARAQSRLGNHSHKFISTALCYRKLTSAGVKIFQSMCIIHTTNGMH